MEFENNNKITIQTGTREYQIFNIDSGTREYANFKIYRGTHEVQCIGIQPTKLINNRLSLNKIIIIIKPKLWA